MNAFASFLLGTPSEIARSQILLSPTMRQSHYDAFIQDAYKVTPKLTINMGLRYDFFEAVKVRYAGGASNYEPYDNTLLIAGYGDVSLSDGVNSRPGYWAPRLGIAYSLTNKTVLRTGYGISYWEQRFGYTGGSLNNQYPVIYNQVVGTTSQYTPAGSFASLPPVQYLPIPSNGILSPAPNQAFYYMPSHFNLPEVYNWNFTLQHQFTPTLVVDAGWVGNQGRNNPYAYNLNQGLPGAGPTAEIENLEYGRTASTTIRAYGANSNYNALQVNATKTWGRGLHVSLAYAFSKWLDTTGEDAGFLNPYNWNQSYGPDGLNSKHILTINHVYELPFAKGQPFLNSGGLAARILGGWQFSGIFRYLSGTPFTVSSPTTNADCAGCSVVPNIIGTPQYPGLYGPGELYLSPSAFTYEALDTYGNSGRDNLLSPGQTVHDGNVARKFQLKERMMLEFRLEATNVTNHPHWGSPSATDIATLRTSELLSAHRIDGAEQYFTRAIDYGYSFDPEEVIEKWGRKDIVGDYVRFWRMLRPDVIVTMNIQGRGGDRTHEAQTILVRESFRKAGDPSQYPEQLREGLRVWQPRKLYFAGAEVMPGGARVEGQKLAPVPTDTYDELLGRTYADIGTDAHSNHKCQGVGGFGGGRGGPGGRGRPGGRGGATAAMGRGGFAGFGGGRGYSLIDTTLAGEKDKQESGLFDGIDTSLTGVAQYAGSNPPSALTGALAAILADATAAQKVFADGQDAATAAPIAAGLTKIRALRAQLGSMGLSDSARYEVDFRLQRKERDYEDAVLAAHDVNFDALADDGLVIGGQPVHLTLTAVNHGPSEISVTSVAIAGFDGPAECAPGDGEEERHLYLQLRRPNPARRQAHHHVFPR